MPNRITGTIAGKGLRVGVVVSRWNREVTEGLEKGAYRALAVTGVEDDDIWTVEVPGAFEIPLALEYLAASGEYDALVALGCVIKGETAHFEYISNAAMEGIRTVMLKHAIPIGCGVLTTYTVDQALARAAADEENKGSEAALSAIEMAMLAEEVA